MKNKKYIITLIVLAVIMFVFSGVVICEASNSISCDDKDKENNIYVKGIVTELRSIENAFPNITFYEDYCLDKNTLIQYYCINNTDSSFKSYNCINGCSDGVCERKDKTPFCGDGICEGDENYTNCPKDCKKINCKDSDKGKDYYKKGILTHTITGYGASIFPNTSIKIEMDICFDNKTLKEYYCSGNNYFFEKYKCPKYCYNGACVDEIPKSSENNNCTDSDGGKNYYVKGTLTAKNGEQITDYCSNDYYVKEYFCPTNYDGIDSVDYNCPNGCKDGACINLSGDGETTEDDPSKNSYLEEKKINNFRVEEGYYVFDIFFIFEDFYIDGVKVDDVQKYYLGGAVHTLYKIPCKEGKKLEAFFVNNYSGHQTRTTYDISQYNCDENAQDGFEQTEEDCPEFYICPDGITKVEWCKKTTFPDEYNEEGSITTSASACQCKINPQEACPSKMPKKPAKHSELDLTCKNSCQYKNKCIPFGTRVEETQTYCSIEEELESQKQIDAKCQNNYECISNACISGKCMDVEAQLSFLKKLWCKVINLFDKEAYEECLVK
ncbi:MAG: hypothetical protein B6U87_00915 [Candidatus Aenigmarchaeota archaeon ex4484_52]|nr:MAG: hypothetical protein B6U87_00915 [Candidatus Aenigmarchaeota archaeon ex4484_52]